MFYLNIIDTENKNFLIDTSMLKIFYTAPFIKNHFSEFDKTN